MDFHQKRLIKRTCSPGFHPSPIAQKNAITPGQVIHHEYTKLRGGKGGQARFAPSSYVGCVVNLLIQGILRNPYLWFLISFLKKILLIAEINVIRR
jgi:hypothetical protein